MERKCCWQNVSRPAGEADFRGELLKAHPACCAPPATDGRATPGQTVRRPLCPDRVLAILPHALRRCTSRTPMRDQDPLTLGVMLNLSDQAGFDAFAEADFDDPELACTTTNRLPPTIFTARFGPTQQAYDSVLAYLQQNGFTLAVGSANRQTITVRGTRAQVEAAFNVQLNDYVLGSTTFHSNATDPSVPQSVAPLIRSIVGLSNLYQPKRPTCLFPTLPWRTPPLTTER